MKQTACKQRLKTVLVLHRNYIIMKKIFFFGTLVLSALFSCEKQPDTSRLSNAFVVSSTRSKDAQFSNYTTYFVSDTIARVSNNNSNDTIITGPAALTIVGEIKNQMNARGYRFVARPARPDLLMRTIAIRQVNAAVIYPPGWWWGYPGYPGFCDFWGCYPPFYPLPPQVYKYSVGDFITETFDLRNAESNNNLQAIWLFQLSGVLSSTEATNVTRTVDGIKQAFEQSPYVKK